MTITQTISRILCTACLAVCLAACAVAPVVPTSTATSAPTETPLPTITPSPVCQTHFEHRELREPYKHGINNTPRFTLDENELKAYYQLMHIESLCIPPEAGVPFINADWSVEGGVASQGRMVSLGFENTYSGSGWSAIYLVYSTFDFSGGTEYVKFMTSKELSAYRGNTLEGITLLQDGLGFTRYMPGWGYETYPIFKTYTYPFDTDYTALVIKLGDFKEEFETDLKRAQNGEISDSVRSLLPLFESMGDSLRVQPE